MCRSEAQLRGGRGHPKNSLDSLDSAVDLLLGGIGVFFEGIMFDSFKGNEKDNHHFEGSAKIMTHPCSACL